MSNPAPRTRPVPMVAVGPDDAQERALWIEALSTAIDESSFCLGSAVDRFEAACRDRLAVPHAIGMNSGTDAIRLGLQAVGIGAGSRVIVPAYSFFATASSVAHLGATPIFVDVDPGTGLIDAAAAVAAMEAGADAVIPVHLYGQGAEMETILAAAARTGTRVIEDSAQSFGVEYRGRMLGTLGDAGAYSFYPTKNLGAAGDAGLAVSRDDEIAARIRSLRVHGDAGGYDHRSLGWNARMDGFQGAILSVKLARLAEVEAARARNVEAYLAALSAHDLLERARPLDRTPGSAHCWHQFIVRIRERERVRDALTGAGIGSGLYYPGILPTQPVFSSLGHRADEFPAATELAETALALPIHHRLEPGDPERVVEVIAGALR